MYIRSSYSTWLVRLSREELTSRSQFTSAKNNDSPALQESIVPFFSLAKPLAWIFKQP